MPLYLEILHVESDCVVVSLHDIRPHLTYVQHYHNWSHIFHGFDSIYSNIIHMLLHSIIIGCHLYMNSCNTSIFDQHIMRKKTPKPFVETERKQFISDLSIKNLFNYFNPTTFYYRFQLLCVIFPTDGFAWKMDLFVFLSNTWRPSVEFKTFDNRSLSEFQRLARSFCEK